MTLTVSMTASLFVRSEKTLTQFRVRLGVSRLIMACRDREKGQEARKAILMNATQGVTPRVEVWEVDMAVKSSVTAFAKSAAQELDRIDAILLNAGIDTNVFAMANGDESTMTVNVISPFLLALALLPKLKDTADERGVSPRVTFLDSCIHIFAPDVQLTAASEGQIFSTLADATTADMHSRYYLSKLMVGLCMREFAAQVDRRRIVVNSVNPGWCKTNLFRIDDGGLGGRIGLRLIGRTSEQGSRTLVHAITAGPETHGCYLSECKIKMPSAFIRSAAGQKTQRRLWSELVVKLEAVLPGVTWELARA